MHPHPRTNAALRAEQGAGATHRRSERVSVYACASPGLGGEHPLRRRVALESRSPDTSKAENVTVTVLGVTVTPNCDRA